MSHGENEGPGAPQVSAFVAAEGSGFADTQLSGETATVLKDELRCEEKTFCGGDEEEKEEKNGCDSSDGWDKSSFEDVGLGYTIETV